MLISRLWHTEESSDAKAYHFTGALERQKRDVLVDIAWTCELPEDGTRDDLITRIKFWFDLQPGMCGADDPRYCGLSVTKRGTRQKAPHTSHPADSQAGKTYPEVRHTIACEVLLSDTTA
jgi:hypothetical protein